MGGAACFVRGGERGVDTASIVSADVEVVVMWVMNKGQSFLSDSVHLLFSIRTRLFLLFLFTTMDVDLPTAKFQKTLPYALLAVPNLAALHARRTAESSDDWCAKCGYHLHLGDSTARIVHKAWRRTCGNCQWPNHAPIASVSRSKTEVDPPILSQTPRTPVTSHSPSPVPSSHTTTPTRDAESTAVATAKPRMKKKSVLQDMLSRNRQKEQDRKSNDQPGGLAAFLTNL